MIQKELSVFFFSLTERLKFGKLYINHEQVIGFQYDWSGNGDKWLSWIISQFEQFLIEKEFKLKLKKDSEEFLNNVPQLPFDVSNNNGVIDWGDLQE